LRGVEFRGDEFDSLEPGENYTAAELASFTLNHNCLCACVIECAIPVSVVMGGETTRGLLHVHLDLGGPAPRGRIDREDLSLELVFGDRAFRSAGKSGWFEEEMLDIQRQLPVGVFLKTCLNCAFSDYSPYGYGSFGGLACFRDNKVGYRAAKGKEGIF